MFSPRTSVVVLLFIAALAICACADTPELVVRPESLSFRQLGPTTPAPLQFRVAAEEGTLGAFTAAASTTSGGSWLTVSPSSGNGPTTLTASVNTAGLAAGEYSGRILITAAGMSNSPKSVRVQLAIGTVSGEAALSVRPGEMEFEIAQGAAAPAPRQVAVSTLPATSWTAAAAVTSPAAGRWLRVSPAGGTGSGMLQVDVDPTGLTRGEYEGVITVTGGGRTVRVKVELEIESPREAGLRLEPRAFNFVIEPNAARTASRAMEIRNSGSGTFPWSAAAQVVTPAGGRWLSVTPTSGSGNGRVTVQVDATGLAAGNYTGKMVVTSGTMRAESNVFLRVLEPARPRVQVTPKVVNFSAAPGATPTGARNIEVRSSTAGLSFTATATTARGGDWLRITPTSGAVPGSIAVSLNPAVVSTLAPAVYTGTVQVRVPGAAQEVHEVLVTLRIRQPEDTARLEAEPGGLVFTAVRGGTNPAPKKIELEAEHAGSIAWTAAVSTSSGGTWLSVSPASGTTAGGAETEVMVSANIAGLAAGTYNGSIVFTPAAASGAPPVTVQVRLVVSATATSSAKVTRQFAAFTGPVVALLSSPAQDFVTRADVPVNVTLKLVDSAGVPIENAGVFIRSSGDSSEFVLSDIGGGEYSGVFRPLSSGRVALTGTVQVERNAPVAVVLAGDIESAPATPAVIFPGGVVSAATFADSPTPIAPGSLVSLFGAGIVPASASAASAPLPLELSGVSVTIGGIRAPLLSVTRGAFDQINFQVPFELAGVAQADIVVNNNGVVTAAETISIAPALPGLFTLSQTGTGAAAALHADFSPISAATSATAGETVLLFATGLGAVSGNAGTGNAAAGEVPVTGNVSATIGGRPAEIRFAGLAPGFVGLYQLNIVVPAGLPAGEALVVLSVDGMPSTGRATLPIR